MKKFKKSFALLLSASLLLLSACGSQSSGTGTSANPPAAGTTEEAKPVTLRLGHVTQTSHPYHLAAEDFAKRVNEKSGGTIKVEIFPARQIGGDRDMLEMIQNGSLEMGFITNAVFSGFTPVMDGVQLPFLINSYEVFQKAKDSEPALKMLASLESLGLKGLAINESGMRHIGSNKAPVKTPQDLKGVKIRVAESPLMLDIFNTLGASPTPMPYGEIYSSLQTGVIDAHEANLPAYIDEKFDEVTKHISLSGHFPWPNINVVNLNTFNSMSPDQQKAMQEAAKETSDWIVQQLIEVDKKSLEGLKAKGAQVDEQIDVDAFVEAVQPVYEKYAQKDPLIKEFIEAVEKIKNP
ncbi:TRAP transporter substrate-binding protein [Ammoniphilus sp. YIM 78166]|uniref:TRAP transporter substrate-binding protein n=1 Tax=Ammoniphilus sp. YIM 78166 TaxID=1644106 RepID=UPI00106F5EE6|nr:TRAP transporter substrate-binding protein [Ammoniphilus sp. YIM 78166]